MSNTIALRLSIDPMPTPRPRARVIKMGGGRAIASFYSPKNYKDWQKLAADELEKFDGTEITGRCTVVVNCYVAKPKTTKLAAPKPDVDNYAKGVLDAITKDGRFWKDDSQVVELTVRKAWTTEEPHIDVIITEPSET